MVGRLNGLDVAVIMVVGVGREWLLEPGPWGTAVTLATALRPARMYLAMAMLGVYGGCMRTVVLFEELEGNGELLVMVP